MAKGAAWTILMQFAIRGIGIVSTLILARLLVPEDFGLVAIATVIWGLLDTLGEFNFDVPLIRERKTERYHYDTVWTLNLIKGLVVSCLLAALASPAAGFYEDSRLEMILYVLAPASLLRGLENVGVVDFRRNLEFHKDFAYNSLLKFGAAAVAIPLAFALRDYWALVYGLIAGAAIRVVLSYIMHPFRPRPSFRVAREYIGFAKWLLLSGIISFFTDSADRLILGKLLDAASVGVYRMALEISTMATAQIIMPIARALFPGFSKLSDSKEEMRTHFLQSLQVIGALVIPVPLGIWVTADILVPVALGDNWLAAIPLIQILGFYGLFRATSGLNDPVLLALGRVKMRAALQATWLLAIVPGLALGGYYMGIEGATLGITLAILCGATLSTTFVLRVLGLRWFAYFRAIWRSLVSAAIMVALVYAAKSAWPETANIGALAGELFALIALGAIAYTLVHYLLWRLSGSPESAEHHAIVLVRGAWGRMSSRLALRRS
jgi:O-antigen/teichoic acid export membrane protein